MDRHAGDQAAERDGGVAVALAAGARQRDDLVSVLRRLREGGVGHLAAGGHPLADRDVEILDRVAIEAAENRLERPLGEILALLAKRLLHDGTAEIEILGALLGADETTDAGARL